MEKEQQPESLATVTIKPDYAPSEVYSSEPPPAYVKPQSAAVQVAKIVGVTVVLMSVVLGSFILASAYVTANASCRQLEQELEFLSEAADRFQAPPQPEALIQEEPLTVKRQSTDAQQQPAESKAKEVTNNSVDEDSNNDSSDNSDANSDSSDSDSDEEDRTPIHFKLPLQLDFDDLAGALIEKNQKSRMNCVVEKKRAEEVVDHQPKTIRLPFGVNLTTDPRYEHLSGERMAIFCESGNMQRTQPQEDQEETIMIQPVVIPIPHPQGRFPTHMPQQMRPMPPQFQPQSQYAPQPQFPQPVHRFHPMESMRPPMNPMMTQQQPQQQQQQQPEFLPNPILQHIAQQIVAQKIMESQKANDEQSGQEQQSDEQRIPLPEEILTQLNRLPNRDVIVAVSEPDQDSEQPSQEMRVVQAQRTNPSEMNGRQTYGRAMLMPVNMVPAQSQEQQQPSAQEPQAAASEDARPHYVQPRSVRSVDAVLGKSQKRVKRCSCDCAC